MSNSWDLWTIAHQAPLSMGLSREEHWRGLPFPSPGDFPDPGIKLASPAVVPVVQADSLLLSHWEASKHNTLQLFEKLTVAFKEFKTSNTDF